MRFLSHLKIAALLFLALAATAGGVYALDLEITGEIKTGLFSEQRTAQGVTTTYARMYNSDGDSGPAEGRIRLGINATDELFGIRSRFYQTDFMRKTGVEKQVGADYIYAYGHLFAEQFTVSAGLLGESPWGSGGPELFRELEYTNGGDPIAGVRFEIKPALVPGLNVGFVLNGPDDTVPQDDETRKKITFGDLFLESILGIAWEHDYFAFRFGYRLDRGIESSAAISNGERLVYRVEERILRTFLPGMAIWANGYGYGINAAEGSGRSIPGYVQHWLYIAYEPENFSTGVNTGYYDGFKMDAQQLEIRPYFYYKFFDNFLSVGAMAGMNMGFNSGKTFDDMFYNFWFVEPQARVNINGNLYAAVVYRFTSGAYLTDQANYQNDKDQTTHWVNLRLAYSF